MLRLRKMKKAVLLLGLGPYISNLTKTINHCYPSYDVFVASYNKPRQSQLKNYWISLVEDCEVDIIENFFQNSNYRLAGVINRLDNYITLHGKVASKLNLPGPSNESLSCFRFKSETYKFMVDSNLSRFHPHSKITNFDKFVDSWEEFDFPFVIKPVVGAKSRGVFVVKNKADINRAVKTIRKHYYKPSIARLLENSEILIEEYIEGKQIAPVSYVDSDGELHMVAGVDVIRGPDVGQKHIQNVYRTTPSIMTEKQLAKVKWLLQKLVSLTGIKSTFLDPELYWVGDRLYLIEINCRLGGFRNTLLKEAYGVDLDKAVVDLALGKKPDFSFTKNRSCTACEIWDDRTGQIMDFVLPDGYEYIELSQKFKIGDEYIAPPQSDKPLASFYLSTDSGDSLELAHEMRSKVRLEIG